VVLEGQAGFKFDQTVFHGAPLQANG
jgi:hypothetical protein